MTVRIDDLTDRQLDRMVSLALGETPFTEDRHTVRERLRLVQGPMAREIQHELAKELSLHVYDENLFPVPLAGYSTDWAHGGPIIEACRIALLPGRDGDWVARCECGRESRARTRSRGPTPLIAAMRCYAISKLGETVDL